MFQHNMIVQLKLSVLCHQFSLHRNPLTNGINSSTSKLDQLKKVQAASVSPEKLDLYSGTSTRYSIIKIQ